MKVNTSMDGGASRPSPMNSAASPDGKETKKKKKGIFGGLFKKGKKSKEEERRSGRSSSNGRSLRSPNARSIKNSHTEASI